MDPAKLRKAIAVAAVVTGIPLFAYAQLVRLGDPEISFLASGPMGMKIKGTTSALEIADDGRIVDVRVSLAGLKTGIDLRDRHMREKYLQVQAFPQAELKVQRALVHVPAAGQESAGKFAAPLALHGKAGEVTVSYTARRVGDRVQVTASFPVNMSRFGIETPSYMGATVKPDVLVTARFEVADR